MEKIRLLADLAEFAQKQKYKVSCCASYDENVVLTLKKPQVTFSIFVDLEDPQTSLLKEVVLEKNCKQPERKHFNSLKSLQTSLQSYK
jgi:hypothetical protein